MRATTAAKLQVGPHQKVAFAGDEITLDVAREGITLENGWKITPFTHPGVSFIYTLPLHLQSTCTLSFNGISNRSQRNKLTILNRIVKIPTTVN